MWTDFLLSAERFYYKATFWPVLLGSIFTIWSLIFTYANMTNEHGKPYIYSSYDWSSSTIKPIGFYFASVIILTIISIIAAFIKKEFDKKYNPTWHCIVGRNFGSYVTHETKHFIYFYLGQVAILLFKSG